MTIKGKKFPPAPVGPYVYKNMNFLRNTFFSDIFIPNPRHNKSSRMSAHILIAIDNIHQEQLTYHPLPSVYSSSTFPMTNYSFSKVLFLYLPFICKIYSQFLEDNLFIPEFFFFTFLIISTF